MFPAGSRGQVCLKNTHLCFCTISYFLSTLTKLPRTSVHCPPVSVPGQRRKQFLVGQSFLVSQKRVRVSECQSVSDIRGETGGRDWRQELSRQATHVSPSVVKQHSGTGLSLSHHSRMFHECQICDHHQSHNVTQFNAVLRFRVRRF